MQLNSLSSNPASSGLSCIPEISPAAKHAILEEMLSTFYECASYSCYQNVFLFLEHRKVEFKAITATDFAEWFRDFSEKIPASELSKILIYAAPLLFIALEKKYINEGFFLRYRLDKFIPNEDHRLEFYYACLILECSKTLERIDFFANTATSTFQKLWRVKQALKEGYSVEKVREGFDQLKLNQIFVSYKECYRADKTNSLAFSFFNAPLPSITPTVSSIIIEKTRRSTLLIGESEIPVGFLNEKFASNFIPPHLKTLISKTMATKEIASSSQQGEEQINLEEYDRDLELAKLLSLYDTADVPPSEVVETINLTLSTLEECYDLGTIQDLPLFWSDRNINISLLEKKHLVDMIKNVIRCSKTSKENRFEIEELLTLLTPLFFELLQEKTIKSGYIETHILSNFLELESHRVSFFNACLLIDADTTIKMLSFFEVKCVEFHSLNKTYEKLLSAFPLSADKLHTSFNYLINYFKEKKESKKGDLPTEDFLSINLNKETFKDFCPCSIEKPIIESTLDRVPPVPTALLLAASPNTRVYKPSQKELGEVRARKESSLAETEKLISTLDLDEGDEDFNGEEENYDSSH